MDKKSNESPLSDQSSKPDQVSKSSSKINDTNQPKDKTSSDLGGR